MERPNQCDLALKNFDLSSERTQFARTHHLPADQQTGHLMQSLAFQRFVGRVEDATLNDEFVASVTLIAARPVTPRSRITLAADADAMTSP